VGTHTA
jgi:hypothetical protein